MPLASELSINSSASALLMAQTIFGQGVSIQSASYTGAAEASGIYSGGDTTAPGLVPSDEGVILSTGRASDVTNSSGTANISGGQTTSWGTAGDTQLTQIAGMSTFDAAVFEATFIPQGSVLTMQVTFSSDEYLEYVNSGFNDAVGIFVNGTKAEMTIGDGDISIDNINTTSNSNLYLDNPAGSDTYNSEMDGLTVTLTLKAFVNPGAVNTIKIGIADAGDSAYDSNLLIAAESVQTAMIAQDDIANISGVDGETTVDVLSNDSTTGGGTLTITHINGQPVSAGASVTLTTGEIVTLNPDGTLTIEGSGSEGSNPFSYQAQDINGNTDTAFVTVNTVACFTAGSKVVTRKGEQNIEALQAGDLVFTRDNGFQRVRWVGTSVRKAIGPDAPVVFEEGALGAHKQTMVSPNHRILVVSPYATLMFDANEVLVKAKDLINDGSIRRLEDGSEVTYVHVLFEQHEIILVDGLLSESYHPGQFSAESFDQETHDEVVRMMPELDPLQFYSNGPSARISLKAHEAQVLSALGTISNASDL